MSNLVTSQRGKDFIELKEGLRLKPYLCSAGKLTIGIGHVIKKYEDFSSGITLEKAYELRDTDLRIPEIYINAVLGQEKIKGDPLNQNEFDALVSFAFNLGVGALDQSTLLKLLKAGNRMAAADEFPKWCNERKNGRLVRSAGLYKRRMQERALFLEPVNA